MRVKGWLAASAIAVGSAVLGGCVVAPPEPYYVNQPVMVAPPPPRVEVVGVAPAPGYIWIDGFWGWSGRHHEWHPGRWEAPRPGYAWRPHQWQREGSYWRERGGRWERH
ncbi:MAG TPA: hypothetical protein VJ576_18155 [Rhodocyclaceae bacterium]|nr:hypothetical protein [Rhodocyclaceae bacterium]